MIYRHTLYLDLLVNHVGVFSTPVMWHLGSSCVRTNWKKILKQRKLS